MQRAVVVALSGYAASALNHRYRILRPWPQVKRYITIPNRIVFGGLFGYMIVHALNASLGGGGDFALVNSAGDLLFAFVPILLMPALGRVRTGT